MNDGPGRRWGCAERTAAPAWAGLLSPLERRRLDMLSRQWAGPGVASTCLRAAVEAALDDAATSYDRTTGSDFLVQAVLALRARLRWSSRGPRNSSAQDDVRRQR
jgi:hypothetical protein